MNVRAWLVDLDLDGALDLESVLPPAERDRLHRFATPVLQRRYAVAHGALRWILSSYTGVHPRAIALSCRSCARCGARHGKPELRSPNRLRFNLSHSAGLALVALTCGAEIGVDIERVDDRLLAGLDARQCLSDREHALFASASASEQPLRLYDAWVRKEAYLKAVGVGLTRPLREVEVAASRSVAETLTVVEDGRRWTIRALDVPTGFTAALAVEGRLGRVVHRRFTWPDAVRHCPTSDRVTGDR